MDVILEYSAFIIVFAFVIYLCIASEFANIAAMKGHKSGYFGWCFFFGPIGWMMVVALPDLYARPIQKEEKTTSDDKTVSVDEPESVQNLELVETVDKESKKEIPETVATSDENSTTKKSLTAREAFLLRLLVYVVLFIGVCYYLMKLY